MSVVVVFMAEGGVIVRGSNLGGDGSISSDCTVAVVTFCFKSWVRHG